MTKPINDIEKELITCLTSISAVFMLAIEAKQAIIDVHANIFDYKLLELLQKMYP